VHGQNRKDDARLISSSGVLATFSLCVFLFVSLASIVTLRPALLEPLDDAVFHWLRGNVSTAPPWFPEAVRDVSSLGSLSILIGSSTIAAAYLLLTGQPRAAIYVAVAAAGGIALGMGLKTPFDRPRPDLLMQETRVFTQSFPSAHGAVSAAVLLALGGLIAGDRNTRGERIFIIGMTVAVIILIGLSRIYLGVHWPSDVLAGWALGTAWACACWLTLSGKRPPTDR